MATAEAPRASTVSSEPDHSRRTLARLAPGTLLYLLPALVIYVPFVLWPLLRVLWLSLFRWDGYGPQVFIGLSNYPHLWTDPVFRTTMSHSLSWTLAGTVVPTAAGLCLALLIRRSHGRSLFLAAVLFSALLPATAVAAVWVLVYSPASGLLNTLLRSVGGGALATGWLGDPHLALPALFVAWVWSALGIATLLFWAGLQSISPEYFELAAIEGAGPLWRFRHVLAPGLLRVGALAAIVNAALAMQVFDLVFVTTGGGPGYSTLILPLDMYGRAFGGHTGQGAAVASVTVLLGLGVSALVLALLGGRDADVDTGEFLAPKTNVHPAATIAVILAIAGLALPLGWLLVVALGGVQSGPGLAAAGLDPRSWEWNNFRMAWEAGMAGAYRTSMLLALTVVLATLLISTPAAFALARLVRGKLWRSVILALLLVGFFLPTPVLVIPLFWLLKDMGLLDSPLGVILPEIARTLPFAIFLLWAFFRRMPSHVLEAAEVDGASSLQQMLRVALPLAQPALSVVAIWAFLTSWDEYLLPTIVSQDGSMETVPTLLATFVGRYDTQYGLLAAGCVISMLPAGVMIPILRRSARVGWGVLSRGDRQ